ncbi:MAG: glycosyltransferase family 4 protein [Akkermansia sp.]|nr:glycosyltransferase family 4 protein [Akkermansia sp.]
MKKRKKIAILCDFPVWIIEPSLNNPGRHYAVWLIPLAEELAMQDEYEVHWLTLYKCHRSSPIRFRYKNQHFHVIPCGSRTLALYTAYIRDRFIIRKELRAIQPDLLHSWGTENVYGICAKSYANKAKWLHTVQGLLKTYMKLGPMPRFQRHHSIFEPGVLRNAPYLTTESSWASEMVREIAPNAQPIIWDYAVENRFQTCKRNLSQSPTCLFCGNDLPIKNIDALIKAFSSPELSGIELILAGPTKEKHPNLPPNIIALGRQSRENVVNLLSKTWCLIHPSKADTGPTAVKEARVMGIPVILTTNCGAKQYVVHGKSGYVIPAHDSEALAQAVLEITRSRENALAMGAYDQTRCREALSANTMSRELLRLYSAILAE